MKDRLWFDVESRYKATAIKGEERRYSCGLMQNQDIKQHHYPNLDNFLSCGLMQNQDIKQLKGVTKNYNRVVV